MHVGVFLILAYEDAEYVGLPHARGGVSTSMDKGEVPRRSSPCTWGCFCLPAVPCEADNVFPMHVGV